VPFPCPGHNGQPGAAAQPTAARPRHLRRRAGPCPRPGPGLAGAAAAAAAAQPRARAPADRAGQARAGRDTLELERSPEQIAAHLRQAYPDRPAWHLCHETIYQALYHGGKSGLSRTLTTKLRTVRLLSRRRRSPVPRTPPIVAPARLIDERPIVVERRSRVGDWEGDLIVGRMSRSGDLHLGRLLHRPSTVGPRVSGLAGAGQPIPEWPARRRRRYSRGRGGGSARVLNSPI
jgi:transposase, IS30 family